MHSSPYFGVGAALWALVGFSKNGKISRQGIIWKMPFGYLPVPRGCFQWSSAHLYFRNLLGCKAVQCIIFPWGFVLWMFFVSLYVAWQMVWLPYLSYDKYFASNLAHYSFISPNTWKMASFCKGPRASLHRSRNWALVIHFYLLLYWTFCFPLRVGLPSFLPFCPFLPSSFSPSLLFFNSHFFEHLLCTESCAKFKGYRGN